MLHFELGKYIIDYIRDGTLPYGTTLWQLNYLLNFFTKANVNDL